MNENYVSYEIAKLLKEKGFNKETSHIYDPQGIQDRLLENIWEWRHSMDTLGMIAAPTLQTAIKWIREKYNILIYINYNGEINKFCWGTTDLNNGDPLPYDGFGDTYESACEDALKYLMNKL